MLEKELDKSEYMALKEYEFAEKLRESYFREAWVATSILLPLCFSLVGLSYAEWLANMSGMNLLPLALASWSLYLYLLFHTARYGAYLKAIYGRLHELESTTLKGKIGLHTSIKETDKKALSKWKGFGKFRALKYLKALMFFLLIGTWIIRLMLSLE